MHTLTFLPDPESILKRKLEQVKQAHSDANSFSHVFNIGNCRHKYDSALDDAKKVAIERFRKEFPEFNSHEVKIAYQVIGKRHEWIFCISIPHI